MPCGLNNQPENATLVDPTGQKHDYTQACTKCDLFLLLNNIMDFFMMGVMPPVAVLFFMMAGFLIMTSAGNSGKVEQGKKILKGTAYSVAVILGAWLVVNTILNSLVESKYVQDWFKFECYETVVTGGPLPTTTGSPIPTGPGGVCTYSGVNLCGVKQVSCSNSSCSQYVPSINKYANSVATASLLKAVMVNESSCNIAAGSSAGAYGLMQLLPSTANMYKSRCGITANITGAWLTNPDNADASICIAAEYIKALSSQCSTTKDIIATYNGGNACGLSQDCKGETSCQGGSVRRWECLYDNPEHTLCNTGFNETRDYVRKVSYCLENPGF